MLWLRGIFFNILVPGTVAGYIPYTFMRNRLPDMTTGVFRCIGPAVLVAGLLTYLWTAVSFLLKGKGTPAIWLTKAISFIIGEEPVKVVSSGLYKYSRNPMYIGVITTVLGEGIYFQYSNVVWYAYLCSSFLILSLC